MPEFEVINTSYSINNYGKHLGGGGVVLNKWHGSPLVIVHF